MKYEGIKQVRAGQLSACYTTKNERLLSAKTQLKQLETKLEYAKTQPPCPLGYGVAFIESRIHNLKGYIRALKLRK